MATKSADHVPGCQLSCHLSRPGLPCNSSRESDAAIALHCYLHDWQATHLCPSSWVLAMLHVLPHAQP